MASVGCNGLPIPDYIAATTADMTVLENHHKLKLQRYTWPASRQGAEARGVVLILHGVSSSLCYEYLCHVTYPEGSKSGLESGYEGAEFHEPRYEGSWVEAMNKAGFTVSGVDQESYGLSQSIRPGTLHYFDALEDLVDDQLLLIETVKEECPGLPIFVMGESLGGCVAARVAERSVDIAGTVLLAPMLSLDQVRAKPINRLLLPISGCMSALLPTLRVAHKDVHIEPRQEKHYNADPLNEQGMIRARVAFECLEAVDRARANVSRISKPIFILHSKNDTMTDPSGSQFLYDNVGTEDKRFEFLDFKHLWHALPMEPGNSEILAMVLDWLDQKTAA